MTLASCYYMVWLRLTHQFRTANSTTCAVLSCMTLLQKYAQLLQLQLNRMTIAIKPSDEA